MKWLNNIRMAPKLIGSFVLVALLAALTGGIGLIGLSTVHSHLTAITQNSVPAELQLRAADSAIHEAMRNSRGDVMTSDPAQGKLLAQAATTAEGEAEKQFHAYASSPFGNTHEASVASEVGSLLQQWSALDAAVVRDGDQNTAAASAAGARLSLGQEQAVADLLGQRFDTLVAINGADVASAEAQAQSAQSAATTELTATIIVAVLLAIGLGVLISRSISRPLTEVQRAAGDLSAQDVSSLAESIDAFAQGDLTVRAETTVAPPTYSSRDEIGQTAGAVRMIVEKVQGTIRAYETARAALAGVIGEVTRSADQVDAGAAQLAEATTQIGQASMQVSRAIEEVARGTGEQSKNSADVITQMVDLNAAVEQVGGGAEAQRGAVGHAARAIDELRSALGHTTTSVDAVTNAADRAAVTAREGGAAVAQTITSIDSVRVAVLQSAEQVTALGQRSQEVGQIVAAIDDIASQTNLLALNAAIEAARAGEHGKGFTVVAAEVRKLAERASSETKEITERIAAIQRQVGEVVRAMEVGSAEVEKSAALGRQAGEALQGILGVVEETNAQALSITSAVSQMTASVEAVSAAAGHVETVASQTAQAVSQMRTGTVRVQGSVESIAAIGEQTAAGAEEVSASTEEQTASVEEMSAGAQELAALANGLKELVGHFTVEAAPAVESIGPKGKVRRRHAA
ncbi:MAG TPA: methyl-accepting chemotaxis protein [Chloroflexota bacterium]|nr:methyl-accepting chemotaxis protein [Chloroflexota bacterium]